MVERVSTSELYQQYSQGIQEPQARYLKSYQKLTSGKNFTLSSQNPTGFDLCVNYTNIKENLEQYQENITYGKQLLSVSNNALNEVYGLFQKAYTLTLQGINATTSPSGLQAIVQEVNSLQQRLVNVANTQGPDEQYLFAGQKTSTLPFTVSSNTLNYNGDTNNLSIEQGPGVLATISIQAGTLFTQAYQTLETLKNDLTSGNGLTLSATDLKNVQTTMQDIAQQQAFAGSQIQILEEATNSNDRRIEHLKNQIAEIQDTDWSKAIMEYDEARNVYLAALESTSKITQFSLLDFLH